MKNKGCSLRELKGQIEQKFSKFKVFQKFAKFWPFIPWRSGGMKSSDFYYKRRILARTDVIWDIFREGPLGGVWPLEIERSQKVSDSHRNDVSPLSQGLRYRAATVIIIAQIWVFGAPP